MKVGGGQAVCDSDSHRPHQASHLDQLLDLIVAAVGLPGCLQSYVMNIGSRVSGLSKTGRTKNEEVGSKRELETGSALCICDNIIAMLV